MTKSVTYKDIVENSDEIINNSSILKDDELTIVKAGTSKYYCGTCSKSFDNIKKLNEHFDNCYLTQVWGD